MLNATSVAANGRQIHSSTTFLPPAAEHLVPKEHLPAAARSISVEAAQVGNFDVFLRGRVMPNGDYTLKTTVDVRDNGNMLNRSYILKMLNSVEGLFRSPEPLPINVQQVADTVDSNGLPVAPGSILGDCIRGLASAVALLVDFCVHIIRTSIAWAFFGRSNQ